MANRRSLSEESFLYHLYDILTSKASSDDRIDVAVPLLKKRLGEDGDVKIRAEGDHFSAASVKERRGQTTKRTLIGESAAMRVVYTAIDRVGPSQATVLLRGESGTGKELVARALYKRSGRRDRPFVSVHCAAVPEALIESTLFGHERGAFTGATQMRTGQLEQASGGTLFLDEIGDIPLNVQIKLLRVLQEREFERVGGTKTIHVDVRVIAATHRDIERMIRVGTFREDLYYRLNVVPIVLPTLRDRQEDILPLIEHFLVQFNAQNKRQIHLGDDILRWLGAYHWPGNVRELQNCVERLVVMSESNLVTLKSIPGSLKPYFENMRGVLSMHSVRDTTPTSDQGLPARLDAIERDRMKDALDQSGWVKTKAARNLGLTPRQIAYKMHKYGLTRSH